MSFLACPATSGYLYAVYYNCVSCPVSFLACPATSGYVYADSNIIIVSAIQCLFLPVQLLLAMFALQAVFCQTRDITHTLSIGQDHISHITQ